MLDMTLAECVLKEQVSRGTENNAKFMEMRFMLSTSNIVERFILQAEHTRTDRRKSINPVHLGAQIFASCKKIPLGTYGGQ